jgi:hypothetical protein
MRLMDGKERSQIEPTPSDYDVVRLLEYSGPSSRQQDPSADGVVLLDYRNTDENERNISILLSSQGIRFHIERPKYGWTGTRIRMLVTVPSSECQRAEAILAAAVKASVVDVVENTEGLYA